MALAPDPVRLLSQRPLAPSITSVTSITNNNGENEMISEAVHRSPGICLTSEENPGKSELGDRLMKRLCDQSLSQMGSLTSQIRSVESHSTSGREKEGNKEWGGNYPSDFCLQFTLHNWPDPLLLSEGNFELLNTQN